LAHPIIADLATIHCRLGCFLLPLETSQFIPSTRRNLNKRPIDAVQTVFDRRSQFNNLERNFIMTKSFASTIALAIGALAASSAMAATAPSATMKAYAFSDLIDPQAFARIESDKTRSQVRAEMTIKSAEAGSVAFTDLISPKAFGKPVSTKSRQDVVSEMISAKKAEKVNILAMISGFEG
jgi:hypothetical protein